MLKFSTYEKAFEELLENEGLKKKAAKSGISYGTLKKVYNRGMAAWRTGHRPGTTPQQWGMARVNSYIGKGKGTYYGADADLSGKGKKKKESVGEATVKEISKKTAANYIGKASRDAYFKGRDQGTVDAISAVGGSHPHQDYKKSPERKAAMRMRGIDRATKRLAKKEDVKNIKYDSKGSSKDFFLGPDPKKTKYYKDQMKKKTNKVVKKEADDYHYSTGERVKKKPVKKEATTTDAERKAIDAFIKKGKMKKLKPGYAAGYHGKSDPGAGMKGMISPADTKQFGTKKKIGSMK